MDKILRTEVRLPESVVSDIQLLAGQENRSKKNYMETLIIEHVKTQEITLKKLRSKTLKTA